MPHGADEPSSSEFEHSVLINAAPTRVLAAFFDPHALAGWWQVARSVTTPRSMGVYAVEWPPTADSDDILGRLGGVFYGTVLEYLAGRELFVADAWWLPPDGDPIGPMALEVACTAEGSSTLVHVSQRGFEEGARWRRYYEVIVPGWERALHALKGLLEK
jgi:uncharacterized protein YndB with AHSA1/START domain